MYKIIENVPEYDIRVTFKIGKIELKAKLSCKLSYLLADNILICKATLVNYDPKKEDNWACVGVTKQMNHLDLLHYKNRAMLSVDYKMIMNIPIKFKVRDVINSLTKYGFTDIYEVSSLHEVKEEDIKEFII